jgi:hypothetical protein
MRLEIECLFYLLTSDSFFAQHEILITSGFDSNYQILSPEADAAALAEMAELTKDIGGALRNFFGKTKGVDEPFSISFNQKRKFSLGSHSLSSPNERIVKEILGQFNDYFAAGSKSDNRIKLQLPAELMGVGKKLLALKEVQDKIHDPRLKEGVRFTF